MKPSTYGLILWMLLTVAIVGTIAIDRTERARLRSQELGAVMDASYYETRRHLRQESSTTAQLFIGDASTGITTSVTANAFVLGGNEILRWSTGDLLGAAITVSSDYSQVTFTDPKSQICVPNGHGSVVCSTAGNIGAMLAAGMR